MSLTLNDLREDGVEIIQLCTGRIADGRDYYAFIQMTVDNYLRYEADRKKNTPLDLPGYGTVIHTGWGKQPDAETQRRILNDYSDMTKILGMIAAQNGQAAQ